MIETETNMNELTVWLVCLVVLKEKKNVLIATWFRSLVILIIIYV